MGYNYLQSNGQSAKKIAKRITDIIQMYKANGRQCEKVIIVTHSMGGLVTRALLHPEYGNIKDKILGVYHSVQPALGSAAAYKRVRTGFDAASILDVPGQVARRIMGKTGKEVTAVFANAPGPLELLPIASYPRGWLRVKAAHDDRLAMALPATSDEPLKAYHEEMRLHQSLGVKKPTPPAVIGEPVYDIYGRNPKEWWRLLNPQWINPAKKPYAGVDPYALAQTRIKLARDFHKNIKDLYHPTTYASYGADPLQKTYGSVTWRADAFDLAAHGDPLTWTLESENAKGSIVVRTQANKLLTLNLAPPEESGDQTVPARASAGAVGGAHFRQSGYDHQNSYNDDKVLASLLYSIVKIANTATWWDK
jgi:pimeloyl-ACP methyl ester carboxylesterase